MMANLNGKVVLDDLIASRCEGHSMPQEFYTDAAVYAADVERIFNRQWVFVGHSCQVEEAGEFFTVTIENDSLIVIRGDDGVIRALHNVCRHRGTLISRKDCGKARRLVCPYHQWTYERDGKLASCLGMHEINHDGLGLLAAHVEDLEGMLFVCLAETPPDFAAARAMMAPVLAPHLPKVNDLGLRSVFRGWPTFTPDGRFIIGPSKHVPGFVMAGGCNAHGVSGSAGIGRHVMESMFDDAPSDYVRSLSPDRFAENGWDWPTARRNAQQCYETYYCLGH